MSMVKHGFGRLRSTKQLSLNINKIRRINKIHKIKQMKKMKKNKTNIIITRKQNEEKTIR